MASKRLLLVENHSLSAESLSRGLKESGWQVTVAKDRRDAFYRIEEAGRRTEEFDFFAIDLGLPPLEDQAEEGLKLAIELRERYKSHPILAYTGQGPKSFDYALALRQLLVARVSFIYLRPRDDRISFADVVDIVNKGNLLISPTPASYLSLAIPTIPDPLSDKHWRTLKLINEEKTFAQVAAEIGRGPESIQNWVNEIRAILAPLILQEDIGESDITSESIRLEDLTNWYRNNRVKYCRD